MRRTHSLALLLTLVAIQASAQSADGITSLNQDQALAGNVTPGDSAGFPVTLSKSGGYRLTSNLVVPAGIDGIVVSPGLSVVIDLNGFQIVGPATCSNLVNCSANGGTAGVRGGSESTSLTVRNGRIRGFTGAGISAFDTYNTSVGTDMTVEDMQLWNNAYGIRAKRLIGARLHLKGNSAYAMAVDLGQIQSSVAIDNGNGFYVGRGRISDSSAMDNKGYGFSGGGTLLMHYNFALGNATNIYYPPNSKINQY